MKYIKWIWKIVSLPFKNKTILLITLFFSLILILAITTIFIENEKWNNYIESIISITIAFISLYLGSIALKEGRKSSKLLGEIERLQKLQLNKDDSEIKSIKAEKISYEKLKKDIKFQENIKNQEKYFK